MRLFFSIPKSQNIGDWIYSKATQKKRLELFAQEYAELSISENVNISYYFFVPNFYFCYYFIHKIIREIEETTGHKIAIFKNRMLAQISESLGIPLSNEEAFYRQLSDRVGDFGLKFVVPSLNEINSCQKISIHENEIYFGTIKFMKCTDLHHAIWAFFALHFLTKTKLGDDCLRLGQFICKSFSLPFDYGSTGRINDMLSQINQIS